jgi:hypothetical protein
MYVFICLYMYIYKYLYICIHIYINMYVEVNHLFVWLSSTGAEVTLETIGKYKN